MYWNSISQKALNSTHHKYGHFYRIMSRDFHQCSTMAKHIITVTFCLGPYNLKSRLILEGESIGFYEKNEHHENPLFQYLLCSRPYLPSEIISIKAVLVACLYVFPNSESVHSYKKREQDTKTEYFTLNPE